MDQVQVHIDVDNDGTLNPVVSAELYQSSGGGSGRVAGSSSELFPSSGSARVAGSTSNMKSRTELKAMWDDLLHHVQSHPNMSEDDIRARVAPLVDEEFPNEVAVPNAEMVDQAINVYIPDAGTPCIYTIGQWVERLHDDMIWKLEPIRKIIAQEGTNPRTGLPETTFYYRLGSGIMVRHDLVRAPEEGLKRAFGLRPWVWQQWAVLKLEQFVRFQEGHERDFEVIDLQSVSENLWTTWLNDPRNEEFKTLFDSKTTLIQQKLHDHVLSEFKNMQEAVNDKEKWDVVEDSAVSVYQYNSFLGSGFTMSIFIMFLQLTIPILMLMYAIRSSSRFSNYPVVVDTWDFGKIIATNFNTFCFEAAAFDEMFINVVVFFLYAIKVTPAIAQQVYSTLGDEPTIESRLNSLRMIIWFQGDDTPFQQIGFKMDRYMNTLYIVLINALMLIVLFLTPSTSDIILNALAIEFVYTFDRVMSKMGFYDPGGRFLIASIVEMQMCATLRLEMLRSWKTFSEFYDVPDYEERVGRHPIQDHALAKKDANDPQFMSVEDKLFWAMASYATKNSKSEEALFQFQETPMSFGAIDAVLRYFKLLKGGIFNRYEILYTWSRWDKLLFACPVPKPGTIRAAPCLPSVSGKGTILNYNPESSWTPLHRFLLEFKKALSFKAGWTSITLCIRLGNPHHLPFRIIDSIFEWWVFVIILLYPLLLLLYLVVIIGCQPIT